MGQHITHLGAKDLIDGPSAGSGRPGDNLRSRERLAGLAEDVANDRTEAARFGDSHRGALKRMSEGSPGFLGWL